MIIHCYREIFLRKCGLNGAVASTRFYDFNLHSFCLQEWEDSRLRWEPAKYANLSKIEVPTSVPIWWPDVTWLERLEVDFTWRSQGRILLTNTGLLTLSSQVIMNIK